MTLEIRAATDLGMKRSQNEDSNGVWVPEDSGVLQRRGALMVVADGMGGSRAGEVASRLAVQTVTQVYREGASPDPLDDLYRAVEAANHVVHQESVSNPGMSGMGTTCTAVVVRGDEVLLAHVGDSRVYLSHGGRIRQLSQDHSLVAQLVRDGQLTAEQARSDPRRNVVTRSVGVGAVVEVDAQRFEHVLQEGDTLLLCSDGLHGLVSDRELLEVCEVEDVEEGCRRAIGLANARGGHDNITVILARRIPSGVLSSHADVDTGGRRNAWADADHDRDREDVEHTMVAGPSKRAPIVRIDDRDESDGDPPPRAASRAPAAKAAAPERKRAVLWLVLALVVLLLAIAAAAFVLMRLNEQSSALGLLAPDVPTAGVSAWL